MEVETDEANTKPATKLISKKSVGSEEANLETEMTSIDMEVTTSVMDMEKASPDTEVTSLGVDTDKISIETDLGKIY